MSLNWWFKHAKFWVDFTVGLEKAIHSSRTAGTVHTYSSWGSTTVEKRYTNQKKSAYVFVT